MSKSPKNKNNQNKNLFFFIKDLSNNNPFLDPSNSIIKNPLFSPLQPWKRNKNLLLLNDKDNSDNDFKKREDSFTMRLDNIIDKIREERQENSKNNKSPNLFKLKTTLNNQQLLKENSKKVSFNSKLPPKDAIDDLLQANEQPQQSSELRHVGFFSANRIDMRFEEQASILEITNFVSDRPFHIFGRIIWGRQSRYDLLDRCACSGSL